MSDTLDSLREAILAPRPGEDGDVDGQPRPPRWRSFRSFLLDLWPHPRTTTEASRGGGLFDSRLARQVSGWGGLAGAALAFMLMLPNAGWSIAALPFGAVLGSFFAVAALVVLAGLVHRLGLWGALAVILFVAATATWFFLPAKIHPQP